jgi:predicted AAA+ superfamily ATPase
MEGGFPRGIKMETQNVKDLYAKAKRYDIPGRSKMRKADLITAIRNKQKEIGSQISGRKKH